MVSEGGGGGDGGDGYGGGGMGYVLFSIRFPWICTQQLYYISLRFIFYFLFFFYVVVAVGFCVLIWAIFYIAKH